ncbi:MAG: hypothetical protein DME01_16955 [Candidatus Rokuibacteriota bacterium]|nr:MAG: hypothetical protein DME01_16955 [Candidatus Rokubacteria bacterium]
MYTRSRFSTISRAVLRGARRHWIAIGIPIAVVLVIAYTIAFLIDEPLRRYTEAKMNHALKGYTARIGKLDFHPLGYALDLYDVVITQDAYPDPPVLRIASLSASVHWPALLDGRLVGDVELEKPEVYLNLPQARKEIADPTPVKERGWQDALEAVYPLKINHFEIRDGDITYVDEGPFKPLRIRNLELVATNIRNRPAERPYPSDVRFSALVFESGRLSADGQADFLAEPNPAFRGDVELADIELDYFKPITNRYNLWVDKGVLSATGHAEYAQETKTVALSRAAIDGIHVDYVHTAPTAGAERETRAQAATAAKQASNAPDLVVRISELRLTKSTVGFVNKATTPSYRVFLADTDGTLTNLSNQQIEGSAVAKLKGAFMGTGTATADATFRADKAGPSFDIGVRIEEVDVTKLNDIFRAYGRFDTSAGHFHLYSELDAKDGVVTGYIKPLFNDLKIYDKRQDKSKPLVRKMYERVVSGVAKVLKNRPREEVATKAQVLGRIDNPKVGTVAAVVRLVQNALFKAILPGFDLEVSRAGREESRAEK